MIEGEKGAKLFNITLYFNNSNILTFYNCTKEVVNNLINWFDYDKSSESFKIHSISNNTIKYIRKNNINYIEIEEVGENEKC